MICRVRITHDNIFLLLIYYAKIKKIIENNQENKKILNNNVIVVYIWARDQKYNNSERLCKKRISSRY